MTDDYRERIIKWLTGNYDIEQSSTEPLFQELEQTTTQISTYLDTTLGYIQGKDGKGNDLDIGFIYGLDNNNKGVILIVDNNFNIIETITEYNSGTNLSKFICLNIDTTNGNIYGIDYHDSKYRFILLNNFLVKKPTEQYEVKLRNSYFLNFTNSSFTPRYVEKKPNESFYVIIGYLNNQNPMVATYKIEVGSTNELVEYPYDMLLTYINELKAYNIIWSGETYEIKIGYLNYISSDTDIYTIYYKEYKFDGENITLNNTIEIDEVNSTLNQLSSYSGMEIINDEVFINYNKYGDYYSYLVEIKNNIVSNYYLIEGNLTLNYTWTGLKMIKLNNKIYFYGYKNTTAPNDNTQANFQLYFGTITELWGAPYVLVKDFEGGKLYSLVLYAGLEIFYVSNVYNLYTYHLLGSNSTILNSVQQIYNPINYNFENYEDLNSMIPHSVWLYNNNKIIFARNLYNKVVNGNRTVSTLEVPNLMLNDVSITPQSLLGATNGKLVNETETITKNIYEDLFINFYNTITIQNQNSTPIYNLNGATRLNNSISQTMDYNDVKINKIRINYSDNTSEIKGIEKATKISQFVYQFNFQIYVPKSITSIELLSNDELTSYQTIISSFDIGKYYSIKQNVEIEEG